MPHFLPLLCSRGRHISLWWRRAKIDLHILYPIPSLPAEALVCASSLSTTTSSTANGSHSQASPSTFFTSPTMTAGPLLRGGHGTSSHGPDADVTCSNRAITGHVRNGDLVSAFQVFEAMPIKTTFSWNLILAGYSKKAGYLKEALQLFARIPRPDIVSFNTMLSCYFRNDDVSGACTLFDSMPSKDFASWNSMISGLAQNGRMDAAQELFFKMPKKNDVSWNAIVSGYVQIGDMNMAEDYFNQAPNRNDVILQTAMITGYMSRGEIIKAQNLFDQMLSKNLVSWNAMVAGYIENHRSEEGLKFFKRMLKSTGMRPNSSSFSSALLACSNLSALELGRQIHQFSCKLPLYSDVTVGTSLLSMYCKCGDLINARKLFNFMYVRDVVAWNAMISGYAQHGHGEKAMDLFDHMGRLGVRPDWITFVAVLSACNHAGMIQLGIHYFSSMKGDYNVEHRSEHYTCMVDLLCRAGSLMEAAKLISSMPFRPHQAVYGILLGACKIHKNLDLAEFAAEKLFELEPRNAGAYIQLANVYAALNRWDDVSQVRMLMKANMIVKAPGYSWIEVRGVVHEFRSGDRVHPQLDMIIKKLKDLEIKIKQAGYMPDLNSALHDVEDDMKELILLHHSEKLAIAFGLISTTPRVLIRVFKNLRMCTDCHIATKFISRAEKRDIIVRDTTRFHHFSNGHCSCGDYW